MALKTVIAYSYSIRGLDADGATLWSTDVGMTIIPGSLCVDPSGNSYVGCQWGVRKYDANGVFQYQYDNANSLYQSVVTDGTHVWYIKYGVGVGKFLAADGTGVWQKTDGSSSGLALTPEGDVISIYGYGLRAHDADGTLLWDYNTTSQHNTVAVGINQIATADYNNGRVVYYGNPTNFYETMRVYDRDRVPQWVYEVYDAGVEYSPNHGKDVKIDFSGNLVVATDWSTKTIVKLDPSGNVLWEHAVTGVSNTSPYDLDLDDNDDIYFAVEDKVKKLSSVDGSLLATISAPNTVISVACISAPIIVDLYLASTEACTSTSTATLSLTDTFMPATARISSNSLSLLITLTAVPASGTVVVQYKLITDTVWLTGATLTDPDVDDAVSTSVQSAGIYQIRLATTSGSRSRSTYYTWVVTASTTETYTIVNISKQRVILILDTVTEFLEPEERIYVSVDLYKTNIIGNKLIRYYKESD